MEEGGEGGIIWRSLEGDSVSSAAPLGRVMITLLGCRPRQLEAAISRIGPAPSRSSSGALLDESLCFLWRHVKDAVLREEPLDQVLVPMIEHSLKFKCTKQSKQVLILISWMFEDDGIFRALLSNLAAIVKEKEDHHIAFGWCTLVSRLVDFTLNKVFDKGEQVKQLTLLKILYQSVSRLLSIICDGSTLHGEYELPTRLSVAAADCTLFLTEALIETASIISKSLSTSTSESHLVRVKPYSNSMKEYDFSLEHSQGLRDMEMEYLLWDHLDLLIILVQKLHAWSRKSRPLHSKGLAHVLKWMQDIKWYYNHQLDDTGGELLKGGVLLLYSCWKHYAVLMRLEDGRFSQRYGKMLEQYISAIKLYTENESDDGSTKSSIETRKFSLNCLSLLLGRLGRKQLEIVIAEHGPQLLNILFLQLQYDDEDLVEGSLNILRAIIFMEKFMPGSPQDTDQMDAMLTVLLSFLDDSGPTAKSVVLLVAEYCSVYPNGQGLPEILRLLKFGNHCQKKNAIDVISELVHICSDSESERILSSSLRQDIIEQLIKCLGDEELTSHIQESKLLTHFGNPLAVLPELVRLVYTENEKVRISASNSIVGLLRWHNQNFNVVLTLIDCLSNLSGNPDLDNRAGGTGESVHSSPMFSDKGQKLDIDRVLGLTPKWSESVQNWGLLIEHIINKMFQDPSNAIVVRFMSYISEHLAKAGDLVLYRVLSHMQRQQLMDESWLYDRTGNISSSSIEKFKDSLFDRLCPLLLLRVLPLRVFDDLHSSTLYGNLYETLKVNQDCINNQDCVAVLLFYRAFSMSEFEDVRKVSAELCGRLHPEVLLPVMESQLKHSTQHQDIMKIKACLFAICTSLVARERESVMHPITSRIRKILETVLSWPSLEADEVSKAQHGCIDCLALMICAELNNPMSSKDVANDRYSMVGGTGSPGETTSTSSTLTYVIQRLTCNENCGILSGLDEATWYRHNCLGDMPLDTSSSISQVMSNVSTTIQFRLCMANVLISACQKVSSSRKDLFAYRALRPLIYSVQAITCSDVRAACLQILFSAVYHLKSSVLPLSSDLLSLSVKALEKGSEKEKVASAKLMASLMASEDEIIENISGGLLKAKSVLEKIVSKEPSSELQQLCKKLLFCISSPLDVMPLAPSF